MEHLQTNINDNKAIENVEKNLKENEMVHIAQNIHQDNIDSDLDEHNNDTGQNGENEQQIGENEQENGGNELQNTENEQQNGENEQQIGKNEQNGGNEQQITKNEQQNGGNEQENGGNEQQSGRNEQQSGRNEQHSGRNEQQNGEIDDQTDENRKSADLSDENEDALPLEVKTEKDDEFDSYSDGNHVFKKYRFRQRDSRPDYTQTEVPHYPIKRRIRYEHQDSFGCDHCIHTFNSRQGLLNHIRKHIADKKLKYTCAICSEVFDTNNELIKHKTVHKDLVFTCEKCQYAYTDHCEFLEHEITHTLRSSYKCMECGKYYNKTAMQLHYQSHFDRRIECEICHVMIQKGHMPRHLACHKLVKCVECDRVLRPDTLTYHMVRHTGVKPFQCLYCGKGFANSQQRKVHTRTHTNERPYKCDICHQKFKQTTDLKRHELTHFDKKYECEICDKKFLHKESLTAHLTIHSKTQRFKCELCNTALSTSAGYKSHMIYKHSDDKVFECYVCETHYKTKVALTKHFKSLKHKRSVCKKQFKDEVDL